MSKNILYPSVALQLFPQICSTASRRSQFVKTVYAMPKHIMPERRIVIVYLILPHGEPPFPIREHKFSAITNGRIRFSSAIKQLNSYKIKIASMPFRASMQSIYLTIFSKGLWRHTILTFNLNLTAKSAHHARKHYDKRHCCK